MRDTEIPEVLEIWDALSLDEQDQLRTKMAQRATKNIPHVLYLHSSKEGNYEEGEGLGLKGDALDNFARCGYEVCFEGEVDRKTGDMTVTKVNGVGLLKELKI